MAGPSARRRAIVASRRDKAGDQLRWIDAEAGGDLEEVVEAEVALAALDLAEKGPVDVDLPGESLLAEAESLTADPHASTEFGRGWGDRGGHAARVSTYVPCADV